MTLLKYTAFTIDLSYIPALAVFFIGDAFVWLPDLNSMGKRIEVISLTGQRIRKFESLMLTMSRLRQTIL